MLSVPVITISGYLMTSPIWMSLWDLEETHSLLYSSPSDFVPELYPMKPCKITEEKHLHTKLMAIAITRQKEESGGGACCEGLNRGITSLQFRFSGMHHFLTPKKALLKN